MNKSIIAFMTRHVLFLLLAGFIVGCGGTVLIKASDDRHQIKQSILPLKPGKLINIKAYYSSPEPVTIYEHSNGTKWEGDLKQYTDVIVSILAKELSKRGVRATPQTLNSLTIKVSEVYAPKKAQAFDKAIALKLEVIKGDGKTTTINTTYRTPGSASQALDGAINTAITQMLNSKAIVDYINR